MGNSFVVDGTLLVVFVPELFTDWKAEDPASRRSSMVRQSRCRGMCLMNGSRRNARGEATRRSILEATVTLVSRYGYDSTTISRIQKATQRPASSIYWLFDTKDDLIAEALESSYRREPGNLPAWCAPQADAALVDQLRLELAPELRSSESEDPIRLGIMLALEGSAAESKAQLPFRTRRNAAHRRISQWWEAITVGDDATAASGQDQLVEITMALLDGHYTSDVHVEEADIAPRADLAAHFLASCRSHLPPLQRHSPSRFVRESTPAHDHDDADEALRVAARKLVATYGYEGATIARICKESGVQKSSLYWRYDDKDALIRSAVAQDFLGILQPLGVLSTHSANWIHDLADAVAEVLNRASTYPDTVKAGLLLKVQKWDHPDSAGALVATGTSRIADSLSDWIHRMNPDSPSADDVGDHLSWLITRLCDGVMVNMSLAKEKQVHLPAEHLRTVLSETLASWTVSGQALNDA